jgi:hypothetical protein
MFRKAMVESIAATVIWPFLFSHSFADAQVASAPTQLRSLLIYDGGPPWKLGDGIRMATGEQTESCFETTETDSSANANAGVVTNVQITEVSNLTNFSNAMEMGAYAAVFGYGANVTNKTSFGSTSSSNSQRTQLIISVKVTGQIIRLKSPLKPSQTALQLMTSTRLASCSLQLAATLLLRPSSKALSST